MSSLYCVSCWTNFTSISCDKVTPLKYLTKYGSYGKASEIGIRPKIVSCSSQQRFTENVIANF